eukprot:CAMPEP_0203745064 /NCGR_PEP_ID=MMETSP0098-20131031/926_1 /ASSEMBLY_ACC=CAM_ASM_000208 /TAXON_ID=96639 /ORGANISM=" , Strain NY0313808BC1" /LENGTH=1381 /DNA_ID=CAMNT_0050632747 /DNA_START=1902 /DNA_END=6044 /DNA_ORIENTATION=+
MLLSPLVIVVGLALVHLCESLVPFNGQCGGKNYHGETKCIEGCKCKATNEWYSMCVEDPDAKCIPENAFCSACVDANKACKPCCGGNICQKSKCVAPTKPPTPGPTRKPPTPGPTRKPSTPRPTRKPSTPRPTRKPSTPGPTRKPSTPGPTRKPSTPRPTREPSTPRPTRKPSTPRPTLAPSPRSPTMMPTGGTYSCNIPHDWLQKSQVEFLRENSGTCLDLQQDVINILSIVFEAFGQGLGKHTWFDQLQSLLVEILAFLKSVMPQLQDWMAPCFGFFKGSEIQGADPDQPDPRQGNLSSIFNAGCWANALNPDASYFLFSFKYQAYNVEGKKEGKPRSLCFVFSECGKIEPGSQHVEGGFPMGSLAIDWGMGLYFDEKTGAGLFSGLTKKLAWLFPYKLDANGLPPMEQTELNEKYPVVTKNVALGLSGKAYGLMKSMSYVNEAMDISTITAQGNLVAVVDLNNQASGSLGKFLNTVLGKKWSLHRCLDDLPFKYDNTIRVLIEFAGKSPPKDMKLGTEQLWDTLDSLASDDYSFTLTAIENTGLFFHFGDMSMGVIPNFLVTGFYVDFRLVANQKSGMGPILSGFILNVHFHGARFLKSILFPFEDVLRVCNFFDSLDDWVAKLDKVLTLMVQISFQATLDDPFGIYTFDMIATDAFKVRYRFHVLPPGFQISIRFGDGGAITTPLMSIKSIFGGSAQKQSPVAGNARGEKECKFQFRVRKGECTISTEPVSEPNPMIRFLVPNSDGNYALPKIECEWQPMCCRWREGRKYKFTMEQPNACWVKLGRTVKDAKCAPTCCKLGSKFKKMTTGACVAEEGEPLGIANCEMACCQKSQMLDVFEVIKGECEYNLGGEVIYPTEEEKFPCEEICCLSFDMYFLPRPSHNCHYEYGTTVEASYCLPVCCVGVIPTATTSNPTTQLEVSGVRKQAFVTAAGTCIHMGGHGFDKDTCRMACCKKKKVVVPVEETIADCELDGDTIIPDCSPTMPPVPPPTMKPAPAKPPKRLCSVVHTACRLMVSIAGAIALIVLREMIMAVLDVLCSCMCIIPIVGIEFAVSCEVVSSYLATDLMFYIGSMTAAAASEEKFSEIVCDKVLGCTPEAQANVFRFAGSDLQVSGDNKLGVDKYGKKIGLGGVFFDPELQCTYKGVHFDGGEMTMKIARVGKTPNEEKVLNSIIAHGQDAKSRMFDVAPTQPHGHTLWRLHGLVAGFDYQDISGNINFGHALHRKTFKFGKMPRQTIQSVHLVQTSIKLDVFTGANPWWFMSVFCMRDVNDRHSALFCADSQGIGFVKFRRLLSSSNNVTQIKDGHGNNGTQLLKDESHYTLLAEPVQCKGIWRYEDCLDKHCSWYTDKLQDGVCGAPFYCPHGYENEHRPWPGEDW